ncbi:MAG: hypothetical protein M3Y42_10800 [Actinomycetota bacterium]|nr:hypothetical protein [Actinomycetota bacterium]MDQ2957442.1 hypothetical protein [Actinomycetota bacterium]
MLERNILRRVLAEVRWSFTWPCNWLLGVGLNLALSLLWLAWVPLRGGSHADSVILVGTYFAVFILADVTTTNVLGLDAARVRVSLALGVPVRRLLLTKNYALLLIVGLPTLLLTAVLTVRSELPYRLVNTLPGVALPIMAWLGVGNVVSVLLPVDIVPLRRRWRERRQLIRTGRWLSHLAVPYLLLYAVDPVSDLPRAIFRGLPRYWRNPELRGLLVFTIGLAIWAVGTALASWIVQRRGIRLR